MAKVTGLAQTTLSVDDSSNAQQAIINDITNWQFSTPRGVQDVTGVNKSAIERLLLLADFSLTLNGVFNPAANAEHDVFKTVPSTSVNRLVTIVSNGKTMAPTLLFTDYQITRPQTGELTFQAPGVLANGAVPTWSLRRVMGYKRKLKVLKWPEGHELHGLEVTTRGLPVDKLFELVSLSEQLSGDSDVAAKVAATQDLFAGFAERLVEWNLEDDDGAPVPATLDGVTDQDADFMLPLIMTWMDAVASVDTPLPGPSPNGVTTVTGPDMAALVPMETLSPSQLS